MGIELPSINYYPEIRRRLKDRPTRVIIIILAALLLVYNLNSSTYIRPLSATSSKSWEENDIGSATGLSALPKSSSSDLDDPLKPKSVVGKVHAVFGEPNPVYERALELHRSHADKQGHPMFVLRERILSGLWSKPAFILSVMLQELAKPEAERLQWLLWNDADIVLMNPKISLDIFIPPGPEFSYVNVLVTDDRHGLNNGCFLIRINSWAVKLLSSVIAFHIFKPEVKLQYSEQSALEEMIQETYWRNSVVHVPQYWFNAYPPGVNQDEPPKVHEFRPGGLQMHFANNRNGKRPEKMSAWMSIADQNVKPYTAELAETGLIEDMRAFWSQLSEERAKKASRL